MHDKHEPVIVEQWARPFRPGGRGRKYPFVDWADGRIRQLEKGVHYDSLEGLKSAASIWAKSHGYRQHILVLDDAHVQIQFEHRAGDQA